MRYFLTIVSLVIIISCDNERNDNRMDSTLTSDTFNLGEQPVLFIFPDSNELNKIEYDYGVEFLSRTIENQEFGRSEANYFLEKNSITPIITDKRFVKLDLFYRNASINQKPKTMLLDTDTIFNKWIVIINNGYNYPEFLKYSDINESKIETLNIKK
jgi:hypothetical protein